MTHLHDAPTKILEALEHEYDRSHANTGRTCQHTMTDEDGREYLCGKRTKGFGAKGNENRDFQRGAIRCWDHRVNNQKPAIWGQKVYFKGEMA